VAEERAASTPGQGGGTPKHHGSGKAGGRGKGGDAPPAEK
jgi:hypothetical protein